MELTYIVLVMHHIIHPILISLKHLIIHQDILFTHILLILTRNHLALHEFMLLLLVAIQIHLLQSH